MFSLSLSLVCLPICLTCASLIAHRMDNIFNKHSAWKRIVHQFQARRDIPFRKKFFVGYDLHGNTYWEFTPDGNMQRLRRKLEPVRESIFKSDYFETVPPQWLQWLRRTREHPPTLQELMDDQMRQQRIKLLAQQADAKWASEKQRLEHEQLLKLQAELDRVEAEKRAYELEARQAQELAEPPELKADPWAQAEQKADPVETATIKPRK